MANEMIERVARAVCRVQFVQSGQFGRKGIEKQTDKYWREWLPEAHLMLDELRTPTEAMLAAADRLPIYEGEGRNLRDVWQAMLSAALNEQPRPVDEKEGI